jgi:hypothetical protein
MTTTQIEDRYGNAIATGSQAAVDHFNQACGLVRLFKGDPIGALDAALAEDGDMAIAWAVRAGLLAQTTDRMYQDEARRSVRAGEAAGGTERERAHVDAARLWTEGHFRAGTIAYARIAQQYPRDLIAVQLAHGGCFFTGMQNELRDIPLQSLRAFSKGDDGYHAVLGMAAFGLEECGDFARAQTLGEEAVALEPGDAWAVHAVAHVHEMRGDVENGVAWLANSWEHWAPDNALAYHNWWHLALLHLDHGNSSEVLRLYDERIRPQQTDIVMEALDASALLWRLHLEGVDVSSRFAELATAWERAAEDAFYAFNDMHAVMAFVGAGRMSEARKILAAMETALGADGDNVMMTRDVGLPLARAIVDFAEGRYVTCAETILALRGIAQRFGGSHAQRDILTLTALHAAIRGGMNETARALCAERLAHKPQSPWARALAARVEAKRKQAA